MATQQATLPQGKASLWAQDRDVDAYSEGSVESQTEGWKEWAEAKSKAFVRWTDSHKEIVDFILYFVFLCLFTIGAVTLLLMCLHLCAFKPELTFDLFLSPFLSLSLSCSWSKSGRGSDRAQRGAT